MLADFKTIHYCPQPIAFFTSAIELYLTYFPFLILFSFSTYSGRNSGSRKFSSYVLTTSVIASDLSLSAYFALIIFNTLFARSPIFITACTTLHHIYKYVYGIYKCFHNFTLYFCLFVFEE